MNKVTTINLNGNAYQLEESGFAALSSYLDEAKLKLSDNPDKDEIMSDIEQAIAEKCGRFLNPHKTVILAKEIEIVIKEMGPVDGSAKENTSKEKTDDNAPKRLYQIREGAVVLGVCTGLAAYFGVDVTVIRIIFIALTVFTGGGFILVYFLMGFIIPYANTGEEKAAAHGIPFTAQEMMNRAKEGWNNAWKNKPWDSDSLKKMHDDHKQMKEDRKKWKREWRASRHQDQNPLFNILIGLLSVIWVFALISVLTKNAVFGFAVPAGVPVWIAIWVLCIIYGLLVSPLKGMRYVSFQNGQYGNYHETYYQHGLFGLVEAFIWIGFFVFFGWLISNHPGGIHDFIISIRNGWEALIHSFRH